MKTFYVDINADVGEGIGNEPQLLPYLSSCNIACGGHAGSLETMQEVVALAKQHRVKIGAHPSYPDKENFGRAPMAMSYAALYRTVKDQIETLNRVARKQQTTLHHVKPHGALYNLAAKDKAIAQVIVEVMKRFHKPLKLYVPFGSVIASLAQEHQIAVTYEAFADRNYNDDLSLVSRKEPNAIITDVDALCHHVLRMVVDKKVLTINKTEQHIMAETICIHGDNPNAVALAKQLKQFLEAHQVLVT